MIAWKKRHAGSHLRSASKRRHNQAVTQHQPDPAPGAEPERGFLVAVLGQGTDAEEELAEVRELLRTAGVEPVGELVQRRPAPDPRTYVGKGKLAELKEAVAGAGAESLIVDDELDPGQQRRLEDEFKRRLRELERRRETQRKARRRGETPIVALAGYTNAGKSTLLNALTDTDVSVDDRLFETLDPTTRAFAQDGRRYLVTDTVGFIRRLPHHLVEGFAATLEETADADLVLHVADASAADERLDETIAAVESVLAGIGAGELPRELVLNKIDAVDPLRRRRLGNRFPDALQISALTGEGLDTLRARVAQRFGERLRPVRLLVPYDEGRVLAELYRLGAPIDERLGTPEGVVVVAQLPQSEVARFAPYLVSEPAARARGR